ETQGGISHADRRKWGEFPPAAGGVSFLKRAWFRFHAVHSTGRARGRESLLRAAAQPGWIGRGSIAGDALERRVKDVRRVFMHDLRRMDSQRRRKRVRSTLRS